MGWLWKDHEISTVGDLNTALCQLEGPEDGAEFMRRYREVTEHADVNVGYVSGYNSPETMARILEWTGTTHPILGGAPSPGDDLASRRAFKAGMDMARGDAS